MFALAGMLGAYAGSSLGKWMDGQRLLSLFAALMLADLVEEPRIANGAATDHQPARARLLQHSLRLLRKDEVK